MYICNLKQLLLLAISILLIPSFCFAVDKSDSKPVGQEKWEANCSACHGLNPPPKLAPPVRGIVMHYSEQVDSREEFAEAVADFVRAPSTKKSKFPPCAIERFGLMPPLSYPREDVKLIAAWMWDEVLECEE